MDHPAALVLIAFGFGVAVTAVFCVVIYNAVKSSRSVLAMNVERIPEGVVDVVMALDSGGIILDRSNRVLEASSGALRLGLVAGEELSHKSLITIAEEAREAGEPLTRILEVSRGRFADATQMLLHVRAAPLGVRYVLLLIDDRTEEERLNSVRRDFIANVSHELKTPVGAISLLADAVEAAGDDLERVRSFTRRLQHESHRLGAMTKEIIDLTRIQAEDPLARPETVEIGAIVDAAIDANRVAADAKSIRLSGRVVDDVEVLGDPHMLTMALNNLVTNAVSYSQEHTHVGVGARVEGDLIEIAVTDKGIGIDPADQQRVFERFYRVDQARSRQTGGTGLGLSIVKHVVKSHGGTVSLWSRPGHGSTFTMRLPYVKPQA
ncbi:sensor histidine kinase [Agrococcus casei]|uniref:sensor histidine kinase n=1 Tax=Agrococcus casei TaxID=343512 RepID=UPI003F93305D